jgi:protein SCO1/2
MTRGLAWLLAVLVLTPVLWWQLDRGQERPALPVLYTLGGDFRLDSTNGEPLALSDLRGAPVLLNFGYTGCPDVCPTALARMRDALKMLQNDRSRVQPVFVTLDPEVDTVDRIGPYVRFFDPSFIGLTGSATAIEDAARSYKVFYEKQLTESSMGYSISHSSHIYLLDSVGQVRATFGEGIPVEKIAAALQQLLAEPSMIAQTGAFDA